MFALRLLSYDCLGSLPQDAIGLSAISHCGIPWSYTLLLIVGHPTAIVT